MEKAEKGQIDLKERMINDDIAYFVEQFFVSFTTFDQLHPLLQLSYLDYKC